MKKFFLIIALVAACGISATADSESEPQSNNITGELYAELRLPAVKSIQLGTTPKSLFLCRFESPMLVANYTLELGVRALTKSGKFTDWKKAHYNPSVNYDTPGFWTIPMLMDKNIMRAIKGYEIYNKSGDEVRDKRDPIMTAAVILPNFDDVTEPIESYELTIRFENDCGRGAKCHWMVL